MQIFHLQSTNITKELLPNPAKGRFQTKVATYLQCLSWALNSIWIPVNCVCEILGIQVNVGNNSIFGKDAE